MEYYQYFRLKGPPFQPASPHGAVYFSSTHLQGLATLEAGLSGNLSGLTMLTGEAGTGKTTLIYSMLQRDYKRARIAHIDDPKLSFMEILRSILTQLSLYSAGSTKLDYVRALEHLLDLHGKEERIAIVIDESQVLSDDVLEEMRLLSNRGQRDDRCLQLILVGQPELAERLKKPELRQLNQRISSRGVLRPLNTAEALMYVECRLSAQDGKSSAIFEPRALSRLLRRSDGIPRKINMLCHNAMVAAFYAGERKVTVKTAKKVSDEYQDSVAITKQKAGGRRVVIPVLVAAAALVLLWLLGVVRPNAWSHWLLDHTVTFAGTTEPTARSDNRATKHRKASGIRHEAKAASVTAHPVASPASFAPEAAAPAAPKDNVQGSEVAAEAHNAPAAAPAAITVSAKAQEQRNQITVKYGDTLEKIAILYFGSKSGIDKLIAVNPQLTDINQLTVGQIIYLPPGISPKTSQDQTATTRPVSNAGDSPAR